MSTLIKEHTQLSLPFFHPFKYWDVCSCCHDDTFVDGPYPVGFCQSCLESMSAEDVKQSRSENLAWVLKKHPNWSWGHG